MRTTSLKSMMRKSISLATLSILGGVLIALQLVLPSLAFAHSAQHPAFGQSQALDRAGVSVVRLVVTYTGGQQAKGTPTASPTPSNIQCTLLGILVGSWVTQSSTEKNAWVLTDGALASPISLACPTATARSGAQLSSIQVLASAAYTSSTANSAPLATFPITSRDLRCEVPTSCAKGAALIPFHLNAPQPFVDVATKDTTESLGIELKGTSGTPQANQASQFLNPTSVAPGDSQNELGTPIVNSEGQLTSLRLNATGSFSATDISNFLGTVSVLKSPQPTHLNALHENWNKGVTDFYAGHYAAARTEFLSAGQTNPQFRAATAFATLAAQKAGGGGRSGTPHATPIATTGTGSTPPRGIDIGGLIIPYLVLSVLGLLVLIGLLVVVSLRYGTTTLTGVQGGQYKFEVPFVRFQAHYREFANKMRFYLRFRRAREQDRREEQEREIVEANRRAEIEAQRIRRVERQRQPTVPTQQPALMPNKASTERPKRSPDLLCPSCGKPVHADATFCPNCGLQLAASKNKPDTKEKLPTLPAIESPMSDPSPIVLAAVAPQQGRTRGQEQDTPQEEISMPSRAGQQLGNYQLSRLLGEGGFAEVYLGEHIHLGSHAAIKVLHSQLTSAEREKFRTEARTLVRLIHPHIVRVLEFGIEGKTPFLVMDYAPNGTLRQRHPKGTRLPLTTIVTYVKQVADALQYAHEEKLIHRDIKPENMLLGRRNEVLLSDFGIATVALSSRFQNMQDMAGTITYMAPEQIQGKPRPASDQYALGIVVYEWLSGRRPFQGSFTEVVAQHLAVPPPSLREKLPTISIDVEQIVLKALAKDPKDRFGSVQAFATALEQAHQSS